MTIGLFIPCYVDQLRPEVGLAVVRLFDALGIAFEFPEAQTCCGQPFSTAGERAQAARLGRRFDEIFGGYDVVVTPSGSCTAHVRRHHPHLLPERSTSARSTAGRTRELCEFLVETGALRGLRGRFPRRVGLHASCHALRELGHGTPSESRAPARPDPARQLLGELAGLELVPLERRDECCGFGGLFSIEEEAVSCRMGLDRLADHERAGAEVVTSSDVSCLLQLEGLARRRGSPLVFRHVAEILAEAIVGDSAERAEERSAPGAANGPR
jgi:L-lactate dehydrogenase complex protein LldE